MKEIHKKFQPKIEYYSPIEYIEAIWNFYLHNYAIWMKVFFSSLPDRKYW